MRSIQPIPKTLNSYNPKRKYTQDTKKLTPSALREAELNQIHMAGSDLEAMATNNVDKAHR
jgi:hypothetical protein